MQNSNSSNRNKKILFIALGVVLVAAVALGTALLLSRVSPAPAEKTSEVPLPQKLLELYASNGGAAGESLNNATVQKSAVAGYNNARAKIVGTAADKGGIAYFYQTTDNTWHFFTASKDLDKEACSKYDTEDLINAFMGFTCLDTTTNKSSFVAQPQPVVNENDSPPGGSGG